MSQDTYTGRITYEYPKTANLFSRDPDTHQVIKTPKTEFDQIAHWHVTEKIDGTNIRLVYEALDREHRYPVVRGRSDAANLPPDFEEEALPQFHPDGDLRLALKLALGLIQEPIENAHVSMVVFGEGYGPGIQKGGSGYANCKRFRVFDVATFKTVHLNEYGAFGGTGTHVPYTTGPLWRPWDDVVTVAEALGLQTVPVVSWYSRMNVNDVIRYVREDRDSIVSVLDKAAPLLGNMRREQEGVVARTDPYLYDSRGVRIRFKLKGKDLV